MMIFKYLAGFCFFLYASTLYADVTVNNVEKDAKVVSGTAASQTVLPEQVKAENTGKYRDKQDINAVEGWLLYAEQWELTHSGESVLALPVLNKVMVAWLQEKHKIIEIQYPGGEEGEFWVQQLMDWLVSLGIPSSQMLTVHGSGADDVIKFALIK